MPSNWNYNKRIICVDDEEGMLDIYRHVLGSGSKDQYGDILGELDTMAGRPFESSSQVGRLKHFEVVLAKSGEEALSIIKDEIENGRYFAAGFFDMRMPGGIDGYETIRLVRQLDSKMLCAVVTAYTDRSVRQISELFYTEDQDLLLYFNKPFRTAELHQTAVNMVCSWNRKRNEEEQIRIIEKNRVGLQCILDAVTKLMWIPPRPLHSMLRGILYQSLALVNGENGYIGVLDQDNRMMVGHALGKFKEKENSIASCTDSVIQKVLESRKVYFKDQLCVVPLVCGEHTLGIIYMESNSPIIHNYEETILSTFGTQMVPLIRNSMFYEEMIEKDTYLLTDPVTGLYNRHGMLNLLKGELNRSLRNSFSLSMLLVKFDNAQAVRTTYGEAAEEVVVQKLAEFLQESFRNYDIIGRDTVACSEECCSATLQWTFFIFLIQADEKTVQKHTERIALKLKEYSFTYQEKTVGLTLSIGSTSYQATKDKVEIGSLWSELVQQTENNLYTIHTAA